MPNPLLSSTHHLLFQSSSLVNFLSKLIISLSPLQPYLLLPLPKLSPNPKPSRLIQSQRSQLKDKKLELVVFEPRLKCLRKKITLPIGLRHCLIHCHRKIFRMACWC